MFDGSHRPQRVVNLGTKRHKQGSQTTHGTTNGTTNKAALLAQASRRREERRIVAERNAAAVRVQRHYRGATSRHGTAAAWDTVLENLYKDASATLVEPVNQSPTPTTDRVTPLLNARLRLRHEAWSVVGASLQRYATYVSHNTQCWTFPPRAPRIVHATLDSIVLWNSSRDTRLTRQEIVTILGYTLHLPDKLEVMVPNSHPAPHDTDHWNRAGGIAHLVRALNSLPSSNDSTVLRSFLYRCIQVCLPDTVHGHAVSGALRLSNGISGDATEWETDVSSVLEVLREPPLPSSTRPEFKKNDLLAQTVRHIMAHHWTAMLECLFHRPADTRWMVSARLQFLKLTLLETTTLLDTNQVTDLNADTPMRLIWLLNRVARGDSLHQDAVATLAVHDLTADSDDDEVVKAAPSHTSSKIIPKFMSRESLQTVPKLDALFANYVRRADQQLSSPGPLESLAQTIVNPKLWLEWGTVLLSPNGPAVESPDDAHVRQGRMDYVTLLAVMLQATTGLRPGQNASSSLLLKELASSPSFISNVWRYCMAEMTPTEPPKYHVLLALTLFSDFFAHRLIALRDEQFIKDHTVSPVWQPDFVDATDVIAQLRTVLHDLYWKNPVNAMDFKLDLGNGAVPLWLDVPVATPSDTVAAARARLLVAGTKVWNSLYERWCRLVRHAPFCLEATWCFPASISVDNVVVDRTSSRTNHIQYNADDDAMDIDDSDDEMDATTADLAESDMLAAAFSHPKMARLLASIPQALPFDRRVKLFDGLLRADKRKMQDDESTEMQLAMLDMVRGIVRESNHRQHVEIRRDKLYDDSKSQLSQLGPKLKQRVQVSFINQHGAQEAGIDGGGVFKEFIDDLIKDAFSVDSKKSGSRFFAATPLQTLAVNSDLVQNEDLLSHYEFLGRVLGKAVYESILVEPQFCLPFLNQLLGKSNSMEDLKNFDPEFYRNLSKLLDLSALELEHMDLTFEMAVGSGSEARTVDLIPNGRNIRVTRSNVIQYIHLVSHQRLNVLTFRPTRAFLQGFRELIPASWVRLFSGYELQKVISGDDSIQGFDVPSLKQAMQYSAGYHIDQPVMQWFWEIVEEMTADQKRKFLKFMTSCSRPPLMGFESLEPAPCVQQINLPDALFENDEATIRKQVRLPMASTCMNLLKLPNYRSKGLMKEKLLAAIESGAGFELT